MFLKILNALQTRPMQVKPLRFQPLVSQSRIIPDNRNQTAFFNLELPKKPLQRQFPSFKTQGMVTPRPLAIRHLDPKERNYDIDHDGVPDSLDCAPFNPRKQGEAHNSELDIEEVYQHIQDGLGEIQIALDDEDMSKVEQLRKYLSDYVKSLPSRIKEKLHDTLHSLVTADILDVEVISPRFEENIRKGLKIKNVKLETPKVRAIRQPTLNPKLRPDKLSPFYQEESVFGPRCVPYRPVGYEQATLTGEDCAQGSVLWSPYKDYKR